MFKLQNDICTKWIQFVVVLEISSVNNWKEVKSDAQEKKHSFYKDLFIGASFSQLNIYVHTDFTSRKTWNNTAKKVSASRILLILEENWTTNTDMNITEMSATNRQLSW